MFSINSFTCVFWTELHQDARSHNYNMRSLNTDTSKIIYTKYNTKLEHITYTLM